MYGLEDGELFGIPGVGPKGNDFNHGLIYRKDIFDKHGLKLWKNETERLVSKKLEKIYNAAQKRVDARKNNRLI